MREKELVDGRIGSLAALNRATIINHIYQGKHVYMLAKHYTPQSYLATQICLSFICLLLDQSRKSRPAFEVALICSFSSSGRRVVGSESEQPSKRK